MLCSGRGLARTQQASWSAFLLSQVSRHEKGECVLVDIFGFLVECHFLSVEGTSQRAEGRWWGEAVVGVVTACRSPCSLGAKSKQPSRCRAFNEL